LSQSDRSSPFLGIDIILASFHELGNSYNPITHL